MTIQASDNGFIEYVAPFFLVPVTLEATGYVKVLETSEINSLDKAIQSLKVRPLISEAVAKTLTEVKPKDGTLKVSD